MAVENGFVNAAALLFAIVVEQAEGVAAEGDDGHEVAGREQRHAEVTEAPHELEGGHGADEHEQAAGAEAVDGHDG